MFGWSIYNGATYYIDVFGKRFQNELELMKKEVAKWQNSPDMASPLMTPAEVRDNPMSPKLQARQSSVDGIPLLNEDAGVATALDGGARDVVKERKVGELPA